MFYFVNLVNNDYYNGHTALTVLHMQNSYLVRLFEIKF